MSDSLGGLMYEMSQQSSRGSMDTSGEAGQLSLRLIRGRVSISEAISYIERGLLYFCDDSTDPLGITDSENHVPDAFVAGFSVVRDH